MKTSPLLYLLLVLSAMVVVNSGGQTVGTTTQIAGAGAATYSVVSSGKDNRVWQSAKPVQIGSGQWVTNRSQFVELATGMNYEHNGQWLASKAVIEPLSTGGAAAIQGQHQIYFPYDIGNGTVTLLTPSGQRMDSSPILISYSDRTNVAVIAQITNSVGEILPSGNKVLYPNAFAGLQADLLGIYHRASYESDLVFHQCPPPPDKFGLIATNTWLQIWTEFYSTNNPQVFYDPGANTNMGDPYMEFGGMRMVHGRAFLFAGTNMDSVDSEAGFIVRKRWVQVGGRSFLVEEIPYSVVEPALTNLPPSDRSQVAVFKRQSVTQLAWLPPRRTVISQTNVMETAKMIPEIKQEFVMDYLMLNSSTNNYVFRGDTTYLISGSFNLSGSSNVFEGGTVIKFTNSATISILSGSSVYWQTSPYHPVIFTSMNDDSVGQKITGSTGNPVTAANTYLLNYSGKGMELKYARFKYAGIGIQSSTWLAIWHSQFLKCSQAIRPMAFFDPNGSYVGGYKIPYWGVALFNDLFASCGTAVNLDDGYALNYPGQAYPASGVDLYLTAQNITMDQTTTFVALAPATGGCGCGCCSGGGCSGWQVGGGCGGGGIWSYYPTYISAYSHALLTNCLFTSTSQNIETYLLNTIGNSSGVRGYNNSISYPYASSDYGCGFGSTYQLALSAPSPYQPTVAGNYYLSLSSGYKNIGSSSVQSMLLSDLQAKTTDAPTVCVSNIWSSINYTLSPSVSRDTDTLDVGYHYDPIDYLICDLYLTNTTVLITNGTVIAFGDDAGIIPQGGSELISQGAPNKRNYFVHYSSVQEQTTNWGSYNISAAQVINAYHPDANTPPIVKLHLSTIVAPNGATNVIYQPGGSYSAGSWWLQDCEIYGAGGNLIVSPPSGSTVTFDNNLFKYCNTHIEGNGTAVTWNNVFTGVYSNSVYQSYFINDGTGSWTNTDNAFDDVTVDLTGVCSNNAYLNQAIVNSSKQLNDITTNLTWVSGPLGNYYQATNSPLINRGSRTADLAGLYHYTVTTNLVNGVELKETNSVVDIGYHYVATDQFGNPLDTDGDGIPDYLEDSNGNGIFDTGDLSDWQTYNSPNGLIEANGLMVFTPLK